MCTVTRPLALATLLFTTACPSKPTPAPDAAPPPAADAAPATDASSDGPIPGCQASCPTPPAGCQRTTIDPGACGDSKCSTPLPVCHYAPMQDSATCPKTLAGTCIPPQ